MKIIPEWARQDAIWIGWPCVREYWGEAFEGAKSEIATLVRLLAPRIRVRLGVKSEADLVLARQHCGEACEYHILPMGDVWFRDTGPVFVEADGGLVGLTFGFNGWGGKFTMPGDADTAEAILKVSGVQKIAHGFILEGGGIDMDGAGRLMTTRACLLNTNRNGWSEAEAEMALREAFGVTQIVWLDDGLVGDHTDGHIDNLARFIGNGRVVIQYASGEGDPNAGLYGSVARALEAEGLDVVTIPSPGKILDAEGDIMAASHLNFIFANGAIFMPRYEAVYSAQARQALADALPAHEIILSDAAHILTGGGSFHCISQQVPHIAGDNRTAEADK